MTKVTFRYEAIKYRKGEQDPCVDAFRTALEHRFGRGDAMKPAAGYIENEGGPCASTVRAWLDGKTKCPQNITIEAALAAIGWERHMRPIEGRANVVKLDDRRRKPVVARKGTRRRAAS